MPQDHLIISDPEFLVEIPNIKIVTLPKNSTSVTQPLDAGVIAGIRAVKRALKAIQLGVEQGNIKRKFADTSHLDNSQILEVIEEDPSLVLTAQDSIAHWSVAAFEEDKSLQLRSQTGRTILQLCPK
ncbi:hypothetical protein EDD11_006186 [Mortierella claussenii]|nr:hypothetical protein EDD11_006186 [Mortierella claussenii]